MDSIKKFVSTLEINEPAPDLSQFIANVHLLMN